MRNERIKKGIKQFELAEKTGLSRTYLCDIENGRYKPSLDTLEKLAKNLGINIIFLTKNDGNTMQKK